MNGRRARWLREIAWQAATARAVRTGRPSDLNRSRPAYRALKRQWTRHGVLPERVNA